MEREWQFSACRVRLIGREEAVDRLVYLPMEAEHAAEVLAQLDAGVALAAIDQTDWNHDFSPWAAPAVFRGGDFTGGAPAFLRVLLEEVIPTVEAVFDAPPRRYLTGYSLAGLFAVWAAFRTDTFAGVAGVSGSLWFDGFVDFARMHPCMVERVYLSVGDREKHTRNPRMQTVEDAIRQTEEILATQGITTHFDVNPGNHFQRVPERIARGINWMCAQEKAGSR